MRLSTTLLLPALASCVYAAIEPAQVYIYEEFHGRKPSTLSSHHPTALSPEEARLVIAQRLGVSSYHSLKHADEATLEKINVFGGRQQKLFSDDDLELGNGMTRVLLIDSATENHIQIIAKELGASKPDFEISNPPGSAANRQLVLDMQSQQGPTHPTQGAFDMLDLSQGINTTDLVQYIEYQKAVYSSVVVMIYPESAYNAKDSPKPYGSYDLPSSPVGGPTYDATYHLDRREDQAEELMNGVAATSDFVVPGAAYSPVESTAIKLPKVVPMCFSSMDTCVSSTNNCTGHGACYQKYSGSDGGSAAAKPCFACGCVATFETRNNTNITTHWGGGACSKVDISSPFWLISGFTVVMVFLVSWAIGMLFSIGEEKLPGVIGAGVSGAKTR